MRIQYTTKPGITKSLRHKFPYSHQQNRDSSTPMQAAWPFGASLLSIYNPNTYSVFFNFMKPGRSHASTDDPELMAKASMELSLSDPIRKIFFYSASTSGGQPRVDILALGMTT